jgi:hypothetical protein
LSGKRLQRHRAATPGRGVKFSRPTISPATARTSAKSVALRILWHVLFIEMTRLWSGPDPTPRKLRADYSLGLARKGETRHQSNPE